MATKDNLSVARDLERIQSLKLKVAELRAELLANKSTLAEKKRLLSSLESRTSPTSSQQASSLRRSLPNLQRTINDLEREYDRARLAIHKSQEQETRLLKHREERIAAQAHATQKQLQSERGAGERLLKDRREELSNLEASVAQEAAYTKRNLRAVHDARQTAAQRVKAVEQAKSDAREDLKTVQEAAREARKAALVELKRSSAAATQKVIGARNRAEAKEQALARKEAAEFAEILESGENPYEVFRRRRMEKAAQGERERLTKKIAKAEMDVVEETIVFEEYCVKKESQEDREAALRKVKGREGIEAGISAYMRSKTIGNREVIDPTGRVFQVHPSNVTAIKPHSFGLGKSPDHIIEAVAAKFPEVDTSGTVQAAQAKGSFTPSITANEIISSAAPPGLMDRVALGSTRKESGGLVDLLPDASEFEDSTRMSHIGKGQRKFMQKKRSVLEEKYLARARAAQLDGLTSPQIVHGKTFEGTAFLAKPEVVSFVDFEVGEEYTQVFTLTNVSYTFNSFKLDGHGIPDEWRNFFSIKFKQAGRMSAGMTCTLRVTFSPKLNTDINTSIGFIAKTGRFSVPLQCSIRRFLPAINPTRLVLPNTVIGEKSSKSVILSNQGALSSDVAVSLASSSDPDSAISIVEPVPKHIPAYSERKIRFLFSPSVPNMDIEQKIEVAFPETNREPLRLEVYGRSADVPVYVREADKEVDLQCCVAGKLYRTRVTLYNRATVGLKVNVKVPTALAPYLDISPKSAVIQSRDAEGNDGSFGVQLKLRPKTELLKIKQYVSSEGVLQVTLHADVAGQTLPVTFQVKAQLTSGTISISPPSLALGTCYTSHAVRTTVTLTNNCKLPQRFGFVNTDEQVQVIPTFGTLLPLQEKQLEVIFRPFAEALVTRSLELRCDKGPAVPANLSCEGNGLDPPLVFSKTFLHFPATSVGSHAFASVWVRNSSKESLTVHFVLPQSGAEELAVAPSVCRLKPKASQRMEFTFSPAIEEEGQECREEVHKGIGYRAEFSRSGEPWSKHLICTAVCFLRGSGSSEYLPMWMQVKATAVEKELVVDADGLRFKQVAVGCDKTLIVRVKNVSPREVNITSDGLNAIGPFAIVNAFRNTAPGCSLALKVKFSPEVNMKYSEVLVLRGDTSRIRLRLTGEGVSPKVGVKVEGQTVTSVVKHVDFGVVFAKETRSKTFEIVNYSEFPVKYELNPVTNEPVNHNGLQVFSPTPVAETINIAEESSVTVHFTPDHARNAKFEVGFTIRIPNQVGQHIVRLYGACSSFPLVITGCETSVDSAVDDPLAILVDNADGVSQVDAAPLVLELRGSENFEREITIESCSIVHGGGFEFKGIENLTVDVPSGALKPQESKRVTILCAQPAGGSVDEINVECVLTTPKFGEIIRTIIVRRMEE